MLADFAVLTLLGDASRSRFQFLIFTCVIAMGLFLIIISADPRPAFPSTSPGGILALWGISGGSYVTSKGVDASVAQPPAPPAPAGSGTSTTPAIGATSS